MNEIIGFQLTLDLLEEFYRRCIETGAETKEAKIKILKELKAVGLNETDLKRRIKGKKVLTIKHSNED